MSKRSNVWAFVVYPEDSLPDNYMQMFRDLHIPTLLSPVHDKDINADYTEKKKHIHVMLYFGKGANKSFDQVKEISDKFNGCNPIIVNNVNAMIRYFVHYDNPEKVQYLRSDLICISGFDIKDAFDSYTNDSLMYSSIEDYIRDNEIYNFYTLVYFLKQNNLYIELEFLRRHSLYFKSILDGRYHILLRKNKVTDNE